MGENVTFSVLKLPQQNDILVENFVLCAAAALCDLEDFQKNTCTHVACARSPGSRSIQISLIRWDDILVTLGPNITRIERTY